MDNFIKLSSATSAMIARDILMKHRIASYVRKIPRIGQNGGCGYGIIVKGNIDNAIAVLNQNGISYSMIDL